MKKTNKKGFTLVELLAVIVILAIVMLIAVTSIGPVMSKAEKGAIVDEGLGLISAAELAYQTERLDSSTKVSATKSVCFDILWLYKNGYYKKGTGSDGYTGSVLVEYSNGSINYKFWISNETYTIRGGTSATNNDAVNPYDTSTDTKEGSVEYCGTAIASATDTDAIVYCVGNSNTGCKTKTTAGVMATS